MIKIKCFTSKNKIIGFEYEGHAGYDEYGKDIVCSAITAQIMMIYNGLKEVQNIPLNLSMDEDGGYLKFSLENEEDIDKAELLMETLYLGLEGIKIQYEDYITLNKEEV